MPTFIGTPREIKILIDALSMPAGVTKADRGFAESLRERLQDLISVKPTPPPQFKHIRASWPTGFVKPDKKVNWAHSQTGRKSTKHDDTHYLNNSTAQEKIDNILKGLI